ncbi:MAG: amino acid permease [Planctomycetaceae bacterium]|nr:amino acid permease [Planctomycetaceae bacterium]
MTAADHRPASTLSLWDAVSLIVGIVVGVSIYEAPPLIFANSPSPFAGLGFWFLGGMISFVGALIYAELATTYPRCGGEYNYLTRAYGPWLGFLFAWGQLVIIQTGSIGAMAYIFAGYAIKFLGSYTDDVPALTVDALPWLATLAVVSLTTINLLGLRAGARVQNTLTIVKIVGLTAIVVAGFTAGSGDPWTATPSSGGGPGWTLAVVLVLYAYGGWSDAAFVAAEVRDVNRNVPRALLLGMGLITVAYLVINLAYLYGLGADGLIASQQPAADVLKQLCGPVGERLMSGLVVASALGGMNGLILSASRVHVMLGQDYRLFAWLGQWSRNGAPWTSLLLQAAVTIAMILTVGTEAGRQAIDFGVHAVGLPAIGWAEYRGGFSTLVAGSAPAFWLFFLLNAVGFLILRVRDADRPRPFRVPGSPVTPLIFIAACGFMLYSAADYAKTLTPVMAVPLLCGVPVYLLCRGYEAIEKRSRNEL